MREETKEVVKAGGVGVLTIGIIILLMFVMGGIGVYYKLTVGKANINANNEVFKQSTAYNDGMIDDLAKMKFEMATATDDVTKKALVNVIIERYSNFDDGKIKDNELRNFLNDVRSGTYN